MAEGPEKQLSPEEKLFAGIFGRPPEAGSPETLREGIEQMLNTLTYREREIIKRRYGIDDGDAYTLEEVGEIFKVARERVRQLEGFLVEGDAPQDQ